MQDSLMRLFSSKQPVDGVEGSPYEGKTYIVLTVGKSSRAVFSKPYDNAHMMHKRQILARVAVQIQPYRFSNDRCVVVSRRLFGSRD
jgi:hypothetical protein